MAEFAAEVDVNPEEELWIEKFDDKTSLYYYINQKTGVDTWEKPDKYIPASERRAHDINISSLLLTRVDEKEAVGPPPLSRRIFNQFDKDGSSDIDVAELQIMAYHFGVWLAGDSLTAALMTMDRDGMIFYVHLIRFHCVFFGHE
jgi:hypothetical protein